jgi:hypothetical protein
LEAIPPAEARRVSWGAIFAGVVVALVVELALGTLGLAILFGTIDPASEARTFAGVGVGIGIWVVLTALIGLFAGGWTAGRLAGQPGRFEGALHGVVAWGLVTIFSTWLGSRALAGVVGSAVGLVGGTLGFVGQGVGMLAPAAAEAVGGQLTPPQDVGAEVERFLRQTGDPQLQPDALRARAEAAQESAERSAGVAAQQPQNALDVINGALGRLAAQGQAVVNEVDRQDAINVIVARTDLTEAQAAQVVDRWITTWNDVRGQIGTTTQQVGQAAAQATEDVTDAVGTVLGWSFVAMLLGVIAAAIGGSVGAPQQVVMARAAPPNVH